MLEDGTVDIIEVDSDEIGLTGPTTLIIPDIHQDVAWAQGLIDKYSPTNIVMLGDYWDTRNPDLTHEAVPTMEWLQRQLDNGAVGLIGNHDMQYLWPDNQTVRCSGRATERAVTLRPYSTVIRERLKFYHEVEGWLLSHAGISWSVFQPNEGEGDVVTLEIVQRRIETALVQLNTSEQLGHEVFCAGACRGGPIPVGGITWQDWNREFVPLDGFKQIVGHTIQQHGASQKGDNWCIDCMQTTAAIIQDGEVRIIAP